MVNQRIRTMGKYIHEYLKGKCQNCKQVACFEKDENGEVIYAGSDDLPIKKADLKTCSGCQSVQYCSRECQIEDWQNHKAFCKRMKKEIKTYKTTRDSRPSGTPKPAKPNPYPLHNFVEKGDWKGLRKFLDDHPNYDVDEIDQNSPEFMPPLLLACGQGQIECVQILMQRGANFTAESGTDNLTPLIYASWFGHFDIVQLLLDQGVDVNYKTKHEACALMYACTHLQPYIAEILIQHGADVHMRNFLGWTPLMQLVCLGSSPQEDTPGDDKRSDRERMEEDNPKIIRIAELLLDAGADINARGHSSFGQNDFKVIQLSAFQLVKTRLR